VAFTFDLRARPLLLVVLLVVAAAGAGLFVLQRARSSADNAQAPVTTTAKTVRSTPAPVATRPAAPARPKPVVPANPNRLPVAIRQALAANLVVVVALYDPTAKTDATALREARAGAQLAGSSFVPIDVRKKGVTSLNARYGVIHDPAVLVLRPPDDVFVRIDGFADRDTVAQAAVNAAS
jgi:hypothetical protein